MWVKYLLSELRGTQASCLRWVMYLTVERHCSSFGADKDNANYRAKVYFFAFL